MKCLLCQATISLFDYKPETCKECVIHYTPATSIRFAGNPTLSYKAYFYFYTQIKDKVYCIKYFLDPKEMSVMYYNSIDPIFTVPYTEPKITPSNAVVRIPNLIIFS